MSEVTLIQGDCLDVMRGMADKSVDAVITDPPYGVNVASWDSEIPPQAVLDECLRISRGSVIWFGAAPKLLDFSQYNPLPERILIWNPAFTLSQTSKHGMYFRYHPIFCWRLPKEQKSISMDVLRDNCDGRNWWKHPGTKPLSLMKKLVEAFGGDIVLDPFAGSGTTLVAAIQLNKSAIGIERDADYFAVMEKRIREAQAQPSLLPP